MKRAIALLISLSLLNGCAAIFAGGPSRVPVTIEADTDDVVTTIRGVENGQKIVREEKHFTLDLQKDSDYTVTVEAAGHEPESQTIRREFNGLGWLDIALGCIGLGLINVLVDMGTNAWYEHKPDVVRLIPSKRRVGK